MPGSRASRNVWSAGLSQAKNESDRMVCANVFGLCWSIKLPGLDGMRCAALLPTASWLGKRARSGGIAFHGPAALALELSGLRRNHARRRTALCRATPAPLSTSTRTVRSMNLYPHPWLLIVLRHARRLLVSSGHDCPVSQLLSLCPPPQRDASPLDPVLQTADPAHHSGFLNTLGPIGSIQNP
jgi:hypothetical protein